MQRLLTFLIALFVSGCTLPHFPDDGDIVRAETVFNQEVFNRGGKALIVLQEKNNIPSSIKLHGELTFIALNNRNYTLAPQNISVFMVDPGTYVIKSFRLTGISGYMSALVDYGNRYRGSFSVGDGDVVYLGKLNTRTLFSKATINELHQNRKEVVTVTTVENDLAELSPSFLGMIQQQTGRGLTYRPLVWHDTFSGGEKNEE